LLGGTRACHSADPQARRRDWSGAFSAEAVDVRSSPPTRLVHPTRTRPSSPSSSHRSHNPPPQEFTFMNDALFRAPPRSSHKCRRITVVALYCRISQAGVVTTDIDESPAVINRPFPLHGANADVGAAFDEQTPLPVDDCLSRSAKGGPCCAGRIKRCATRWPPMADWTPARR
jgi:hypothetical protein